MEKNNLMIIKRICKLAIPVAFLKMDGVLIQSTMTLQAGSTGTKIGSILVDKGYFRLCKSHTSDRMLNKASLAFSLSSREWERHL